MLCYDAILAKTGIFKGMSQLFAIKSVHWSIIPLTAQALLSPSSCPAVNADLWWRNTVSENMLFKNQSKMAAVKMANNISETFENSSWAHVLLCTKTSVSVIIWFRGIY